MTRDEMIARIQDATGVADGKLVTSLPDWPDEALHTLGHPGTGEADRLWEIFGERFRAVHGRLIDGLANGIACLREQKAAHGYLCPTLVNPLQSALAAEGVQTETVFDPKRIDEYTFGITRAAGLIAETGTLVLKESLTSSRLAALAPWVHIAVADERTPWYADPLEAIQDLGDDVCTIFVTGPSKTADVEGILIEGVHGPGVQICLRL